jgi:hypothetical protein
MRPVQRVGDRNLVIAAIVKNCKTCRFPSSVLRTGNYDRTFIERIDEADMRPWCPSTRTGFLMGKQQFDTRIDRRDLFRAALAAAATAASGTMTATPAAAAPTGSPDKRKARYQAHSQEVENFYRVNRYPAR